MPKGMISVEFKDLKKIERSLKRQYPKIYAPAMAGALNKTLTTMRAEGARMIKQEMGPVRISTIKQSLKKTKAIKANLRAIIEARSSPISLKDFSPRQTKKGVSHRAWNKRRLIKGAFEASGDHIFIRKSKTRRGIKKLWGPGIAREMGRKEVSTKMLEVGLARLPINLIREINWRARKK